MKIVKIISIIVVVGFLSVSIFAVTQRHTSIVPRVPVPIPVVVSHMTMDAMLDKLWPAICHKESKCNANAINIKEYAVGIAQIRMGVVDDANKWSKIQFTSQDRVDVTKSRIMFDIYLKHYANNARVKKQVITIELLARIWNGGPYGYERPSTKQYWTDVLAILDATKDIQ